MKYLFNVFLILFLCFSTLPAQNKSIREYKEIFKQKKDNQKEKVSFKNSDVNIPFIQNKYSNPGYDKIKASTYVWAAMDGGADNEVRDIAIDATGNVYAVGDFTEIGGVPANRIAKWNGSDWSAVGTGADGVINTIVIDGSNIYIGGTFTEVNGVPAYNIARFNGTEWLPFGSGANNIVYTLELDEEGNLFAGGGFTVMDGVTVNSIARWDGAEWSSLGYGTNGFIFDITFENSEIYIGGAFNRLYNGPNPDEHYLYVRNIAKWTGSQWSKIGTGTGTNGHCYAIEADGLGYIYLGGFFDEVDGMNISYLARWDGENWAALGTGVNHEVREIETHNTDVYVGGSFDLAGGAAANYIAKWNGADWESIGTESDNGTYGNVGRICINNFNSEVIVGGLFYGTFSLDEDGSYIAKFTDSGFPAAVVKPVAREARNIELTSFSARWQRVKNAVTYYLDVATDASFTSFVTGWNDVNVGNVLTYSVNTGLSGAATYYYRVRVQTAAGISPSSNTIQLNTNNFILANIEPDYFYFYSGDGTIQITNTLTVEAVNSINIESAVVKISNVYVSDEDVLGFTNQNGITGTWDVTTGTMTLSGSTTLENYQAALRSVTYHSDGIVSEPRTISFTVYGGEYGSNIATRIIRVNYSAAPVLADIEGSSLNYELCSSAIAITGTISVSDSDDTDLEAAAFQISGNYQAGDDQLLFTNQNGITGTWDADAGMLYLMGASSIANYITAMRDVKFKNDNTSSPVLTRTISIMAFDGIVTSNTLTRDINITAALPVELTAFTAASSNNQVTLNWQTATEVNNYGFEIERIEQSAEGKEWEKIGFVQGSGNSNSPKSYSFTDDLIPDHDLNHLQYRLKQIDFDGRYEYSDVVEVTVDVPANYLLEQNYPNPFNPATTIKYSIPSIGTRLAVSVQLKIYDALGREAATLVNEQKAPGNYEVKFDGSQLASGIYYYELRSDNYRSIKKCILMK